MCDLRFTMYDLRCTIFALRFTMYDLRCAMYDVRCTMCNVRCTICGARFTLCDLPPPFESLLFKSLLPGWCPSPQSVCQLLRPNRVVDQHLGHCVELVQKLQ